jgi:hypothetical protein
MPADAFYEWSVGWQAGRLPASSKPSLRLH